MKIIQRIKPLRSLLQSLKKRNKRIGFIPTMGALHEGHASLIKKARKECDIVVLSIFVNPTQFGPSEDYSKYPRPKKKDCLLAKSLNVDIIFYPSAEEMYPEGFKTFVGVNEITETLCGRTRPTHFIGVATVVCKLLNIITPDVLYLGQKDAQQCIVLKKMAADLNLPVKVRVCPTVREKDGLAISSRNKYLSARQRAEAPLLYAALREAKKRIKSGERSASSVENMIKQNIQKNSSGMIDYVACVDSKTLRPSKRIEGKCLLALAVKFGRARLIDNIIV